MEFITSNFAIILSTVFGGTSLLGWIFEKRKNQAQADTVEIGNSEKIVDQYRKALDDLEQRYEKKYQELAEACDRKVKILEDEIRVHKRRYNLLRQENTELRKKLKDAQSTT